MDESIEDDEGNDVMRRWLGCGVMAGLVLAGGAAAASPSVGTAAEGTTVSVPAPGASERGSLPFGIRDEAAMVLVGTLLIGLAGAVRRAA
jgi:hypothetical protein